MEESRNEKSDAPAHDQVLLTAGPDVPSRRRLSARQAVDDNMAALELLANLEEADRPPTIDELAILDRWHGWGAAPQVFEDGVFGRERSRLRELLGVERYDAARRTILNAHYTDPAIVRAMWRAVPRFGIDGGLFIEPGCGRGSFLDEAPSAFSGLGIELDETTARVASRLVAARHAVHAGDFADVQFTPDMAALAIGNVPFGKYGLFDAKFNPALRLSIHDHFIVKSLAALVPGGIGIFITSRYTLDKRSPYARQTMGEYADFLGAVRLNATAHASEAGTDVITDVVVFRRRGDSDEAHHADGFLSEPATLGEAAADVWYSAYFDAHPDHVLGSLFVESARFGFDLGVAGDRSEMDRLGDVLEEIARGAGKVAPIAFDGDPGDLLGEQSSLEAPIGRIERTAAGFRRFTENGWAPYDPGKEGDELARLCEIRDLVRSLVALERTTANGDPETEARRTELAASYATYVSKHGPLNRVKISEATGRRSFPKMGGFRSDPDWPRVAALENFDEGTGDHSPASIMSRRVVATHTPVESVATPADALAVSLAERGGVDLHLIASLLSCSTNEAVERLGDLVYEDPSAEKVVEASSYLSGNVRRKLAAARAAVADGREQFARNVAALEPIIPLDLGPDDLDRVLGSPWIDPEIIREFAQSLCPEGSSRDRVTVAYVQATGEWIVEGDEWMRARQMSAGHEFGTTRMDALKILQFALNGRSPVVTEKSADGKEYVLPDETQAAIEKAELLFEAFDDWMFRDDPERCAKALRVYNDRFNAHVPRSFKGYRVSPPGMASDFQLRDHQHEGIARIIFTGNTALWWEVGTGKTAAMVVAGFEMKRLGIIDRPCYAVPNNLLHQFAREICRLYPAAEVLVIDKDDVSPKNREMFAARVRSHAWDAIVITHSSFTRWQVSPEIEEAHRAELIWRLKDELDSTSGDYWGAAHKARKLLERRIASAENRLKAFQHKLNERQDEHEFPFDESGIDFLFVDEADEFKNVEIHSSVRDLRGVPIGPGSQRAFDLGMKIEWLASQRPDRQSVFATGTPISNTVAEVWAFMRYQKPGILEELGVYAFDDFRRQFTDTVSAMELDLTRSYRRVERLARYKAVPELVRALGEFADIVTAEDAGIPRPTVHSGGRQVVLVDPSPQLEEFITEEVTRRVEKVHARMVRPEEDNMLKLSTECRLASFDWEAFRGEPVADEHSTIVAAADNIARIYHDYANVVYLSAGGHQHPRPGALQIVFSDLSTPKKGISGTAYERLREHLAERGVPREKVAFAHEHDSNDEAKARLQEMCRDGRVAVVVSSTVKFGVGTNVQDRCVAIHHLDCPWRPRDIEQREGRGIRFGNLNETIMVIAYATARSYAVYGWQTLERKSGFIGQLMRASIDGPRSLVVADDETLSYGEVKAIATGDPDFLKVAEIEEQVARLSRLQRSHARERAAVKRRIEEHEYVVDKSRGEIAALRPLAPIVEAMGEEEAFELSTTGQSVVTSDPQEVARLLAAGRWGARPHIHVEALGVDAVMSSEWHYGNYQTFLDVAIGPVRYRQMVKSASNAVSIGAALRKILAELKRIPSTIASREHGIADALGEITRLGERLETPFAHAHELEERIEALRSLRSVLEERYANARDRQLALDDDEEAA